MVPSEQFTHSPYHEGDIDLPDERGNEAPTQAGIVGSVQELGSAENMTNEESIEYRQIIDRVMKAGAPDELEAIFAESERFDFIKDEEGEFFLIMLNIPDEPQKQILVARIQLVENMDLSSNEPDLA